MRGDRACEKPWVPFPKTTLLHLVYVPALITASNSWDVVQFRVLLLLESSIIIPKLGGASMMAKGFRSHRIHVSEDHREVDQHASVSPNRYNTNSDRILDEYRAEAVECLAVGWKV